MSNDLETLKRKKAQAISVRDSCLRYRKQKLMEAEGELKAALEWDAKAMSYTLQIADLEARG